MSQENMNESETSFSNHIVEKIVDEIIYDTVNNSINKAKNDECSNFEQLGCSRSRTPCKYCSQENSESEHTIVLPKGTYDDTDAETIVFTKAEKHILEHPNISDSDDECVQHELSDTDTVHEHSVVVEHDEEEKMSELPVVETKGVEVVEHENFNFNTKITTLKKLELYEGKRLEKLNDKVKSLHDIFETAKRISEIRRNDETAYDLIQFDKFNNITYGDYLKHRFELSTKKPMRQKSNVYLKKEAEKFKKEDTHLIKLAREIFNVIKPLCEQYKDMDFA
tara:strand:+ start:3759 stop:4598 length:840 start_codon:yes stop_codon:yes gene_type:complete